MQYEYDVERVTVTIDEKTMARIRRIAGNRGVSRFLASAARDRLARVEILALLDELDAKHGAASEAERARIDRDMRKIFGTG
jgi:hypothetical protein